MLDRAGQKGTGKWTGIDALEHGIPLTLIIEAVLARSLSSLKDERIEASKYLVGPNRKVADPPADILDSLHNALYASKIVSYAQGFSLLRAASEEYDWDLNYGNIAMMWRGGCIIRSAFLDNIKDAFVADPNLPNLLLNKYFHDEVAACQDGWRTTLALAVKSGIQLRA